MRESERELEAAKDGAHADTSKSCKSGCGESVGDRDGPYSTREWSRKGKETSLCFAFKELY